MLLKFFSSAQLKAHIRQQHGNLTRWHCGQCSSVMKTRYSLASHVWHYHELGRFECAISDCHFTADTRILVLHHQQNAHVPKKYSCKFRGCTQSFLTDSLLANHERVHLATKPYKCSWNECRYTAAERGNVTTHIRMKHFGLPKTVKEQNRRGIEDQRNPSDFIEVDEDLLARRLQ